jgi:proline iminopeptidase
MPPSTFQPMPREKGFLPLTHGHTMYYELYGSPTGKNIVHLHGGPGGGIAYKQLDLFDMSEWNIVVFDQRGCGKSTPRGADALKHNTTWELIGDIELLRKHLDIDAWSVFGGSWGTTLGLVYAETYPKKVTGLILRSVCLINQCEQNWLYSKGGASEIYPAEWEKFTSIVKGPLKYKNILGVYKKLLTNANPNIRKDAARRWWDWEYSISYLVPNGKTTDSIKEIEELSILENHYFYHDAWLKPNQILNDAHKLKNIPITLIHGRYDVICPLNSSFELKKLLPHVKLIVVKESGHAIIRRETRRSIKKVIRRLTRRRNESKPSSLGRSSTDFL